MPQYEYECKQHGKFVELHPWEENSVRECPECGTSCKRNEVPTGVSHVFKCWSPDNERKHEKTYRKDMNTSQAPFRAPMDEIKDMAKDEEKEKGMAEGAILGRQKKEDGELNKTGCQEHCVRKDGTEYDRLTKKGVHELQKFQEAKQSSSGDNVK